MVARAQAPSILIADAEPYICRVFEAKLTKDNLFRVVCASTGPDALQAALKQPFDALLWDMRLRDTGRILPRLRALCPNAALILMTTDDRPTINEETGRLDVADILVKPLGLDLLVERIRRAMTKTRPPLSSGRIDLARIGQQVAIYSPGGLCITRVLDSNQDSFAVVSAPRVQTPPDFAPGQRVRVQVNGEDALYSFGSRLLHSRPHPVPRWELQMPRTIRREQRRKHARRPLRLTVALQSEALSTPQTASGGAENAPALPVTGVTEDVSLGGCVLVSETYLPVGADVSFDMRMNAYPLTGTGIIVRAQPLPESETPGRPRYRLALQFTRPSRDGIRRLRTVIESQSVQEK